MIINENVKDSDHLEPCVLVALPSSSHEKNLGSILLPPN